MKQLITICAVAIMVFVTSVAYALPSDNFNDNSINPTLWILQEDDHNNAWLDEVNQRLEFRSTANANDVTAIYLANNWGLLPTDDFSLRVDFHEPLTIGDSGSSVALGVAKDEDNYVLIGAGRDNSGSYFWYNIESGGSYEDGGVVRDVSDGTLYISYNATGDELYLSDTDYGSSDALFTIEDLLQDEWGSVAVGPFIGGWSDSMILASGQAYLDNFVVDSGAYIPEPATIALLGFGSLTLLRRKTKA
jgi:hypothetical protein